MEFKNKIPFISFVLIVLMVNAVLAGTNRANYIREHGVELEARIINIKTREIIKDGRFIVGSDGWGYLGIINDEEYYDQQYYRTYSITSKGRGVKFCARLSKVLGKYAYIDFEFGYKDFTLLPSLDGVDLPDDIGSSAHGDSVRLKIGAKRFAKIAQIYVSQEAFAVEARGIKKKSMGASGHAEPRALY